MMSINVVKSGVGNIGSIIRVINDLEYSVNIIDDPDKFNLTKKIILPGVGSFDSFIESLMKNNLNNKIQDLVTNHNYSILGICVGMQALFDSSEEGSKKGLGFFKHQCKKFDSTIRKVPHIGWNKIKEKKENDLFLNIKKKYFYFAHSFYVKEINENYVTSTTEYSCEFVSSISYKNIYGVQFHPEKSFDQGQKVIKNFIEKC